MNRFHVHLDVDPFHSRIVCHTPVFGGASSVLKAVETGSVESASCGGPTSASTCC